MNERTQSKLRSNRSIPNTLMNIKYALLHDHICNSNFSEPLCIRIPT